MATGMGEIGSWIEEHPYATGGIVFVGGLGLLWLFGFFSSGSSSANSGQTNMAAAYYAAEAQQATVAGQIQMATVQTAAQTAQVGLQANAATAIAATQAGMATTINGQNTGAQNHLADVGLLVTQSNNDAATMQAYNAGSYALATTNANNAATEYLDALNGIIPQELAFGAGGGFVLPGIGTITAGAGVPITGITSPAAARAAGYSEASIARMFG